MESSAAIGRAHSVGFPNECPKVHLWFMCRTSRIWATRNTPAAAFLLSGIPRRACQCCDPRCRPSSWRRRRRGTCRSPPHFSAGSYGASLSHITLFIALEPTLANYAGTNAGLRRCVIRSRSTLHSSRPNVSVALPELSGLTEHDK